MQHHKNQPHISPSPAAAVAPTPVGFLWEVLRRLPPTGLAMGGGGGVISKFFIASTFMWAAPLTILFAFNHNFIPASVCKGWRDATRRMWKSVEELRLRVPARTQIGFVNSMLQQCPALVRLNLRMERLGLIVSQQIVMGILTDPGFND